MQVVRLAYPFEEIDAATGEQLGNFPLAFSHIGLINAAYQIDKAKGASA